MARTATRLLAFYLVFESDFGQEPDFPQAIDDFPRPVDKVFLNELVYGVLDHRSYLDKVIGSFAHGWSVERLPRVDRAILRLSAWELLGTDIPEAVAIDEGVELAKEYGGSESPAFINGVLDSIRERRRELAVNLH